MADHDVFDARLEAAVRGFADRAQTSVDAAAVAARAMRARRHGPLAWLDRSVPIPVPVLLVLVLLLAPVALTLTGSAPWVHRAIVTPVETPSPSPTSPPPTPWPSTDATGYPEIGGAEVMTGIPTEPGGTLVFDTAVNDPRATGTGTWTYTWDRSDTTGPASGEYRMDGPDGTWTGTCRGSLAADGSGLRACWLTGSGTYEGLSYYLQADWPASGPGTVRGAIVPAPPPGQ
jgi:hypothetical protein